MLGWLGTVTAAAVEKSRLCLQTSKMGCGPGLKYRTQRLRLAYDSSIVKSLLAIAIHTDWSARMRIGDFLVMEMVCVWYSSIVTITIMDGAS